MKNSLFVLVSFLFIISCRPSATTTSIPNGFGSIVGVSSYNSFYQLNKTIVLDSQMIYLGLDTGTLNVNNYITSTLCDKYGTFGFYNLDTTLSAPYIIFTDPMIESSSSFKAPYLGSLVINHPYNNNGNIYTLTASIDPTKNGLNITVLDINKNPISNAQVFLYTSNSVAMKDTLFAGNGALNQIKTDSLGKCLVVKLPASNFYVNAILRIDSVTNIQSFNNNSILVPSKGFVNDTLILK